ncbi:transmembrane protein, putative [Medicago truncatula]|uniref:Transmembrane protein, putative n=1 Tax=Medicago truncatula TaxID=3880 RepID=A0A072VNI4_MEDTR|nr:transmembrane protein, putative [Medicago truncatula]
MMPNHATDGVKEIGALSIFIPSSTSFCIIFKFPLISIGLQFTINRATEKGKKKN